MIGTRVRDLSAEELEALARQYSGAQPGPVR
jgi:hypothetical protein